MEEERKRETRARLIDKQQSMRSRTDKHISVQSLFCMVNLYGRSFFFFFAFYKMDKSSYDIK
uniref:Uncharacterized protein n=1 Tax=Rhizophora mucronata TaxID=61149 RepID=A0A2P2QXR5_RHIMU